MSTLTRHDFFKSPSRGGSLPAGASLADGVAQILCRAWLRLRRWQIERRAIGELSRLDDRELRDMGISRFEIEAAVRGGTGRRGRSA